MFIYFSLKSQNIILYYLCFCLQLRRDCRVKLWNILSVIFHPSLRKSSCKWVKSRRKCYQNHGKHIVKYNDECWVLDLTLEYMEELISLTLLYFDLSCVNWNQVSTVFGSTIARPEQKIQSDQWSPRWDIPDRWLWAWADLGSCWLPAPCLPFGRGLQRSHQPLYHHLRGWKIYWM